MSSAKSASKAEERVAREPLRPRKNPNRIGYQAVAAGEKRTAGDRGTKNASKTPRRRICIYLLFEFFSNSNHDLAREFFKQRICVSKLNIYLGGTWCQACFNLSHNKILQVCVILKVTSKQL